MLQVGGGLDLGEEALGADDGGELGAQDLDGDLAVVLEVLGEVHRGHAARAELALDPVAVGECGELRGVHQRRARSSARKFCTSTISVRVESAPAPIQSRKVRWSSGATSNKGSRMGVSAL